MVRFFFASVLVLLQLFSDSLLFVSLEKSFSLVVFLLLDFMALHMRRAAVCKFAGSRLAFVVVFSWRRQLVPNWTFSGDLIHH